MKKLFFISISIFMFLNSVCFASIIDNVEKHLYGFTYNNENETSRLNRIEKTVYGAATTKTNAQKIAKLKTDMAADLIGKEIPPVKDTFMEEEERMAIDEKIPAGSNIDYPVINEMEKTVFNQEFKSNDVNGRLAKLEQKTFGKTFNDDLNTRVDRLRAEIKPKSLMNNAMAQSDNDFFDEEPLRLSDNYRLPAYGPDEFDYDSYNSRNPLSRNDLASAPVMKNNSLNSVERALFRQVYAADPMQNRLARLEASMFGTTFDNDNQNTRMNRITSAFNAQKSSKKYDSNRFTQNMSTAMQIGTILLMVLACIL